jgi:glycosyltransferase involved in cell wall biosynthesis
MRVAIVTGEYPPAIGGVGDHAWRLARELAARGHRVDVLTSRGVEPEAPRGAATPPEATEGALRVHRVIPRWDWRILRAVPRFAETARDPDPVDVLHIQYQPGAYGLHPAINVLPWWLRRRHSPAVVTTFHDLRIPYIFPKAGPLRERAVRLLATASDAAIAVADADLPKLQAWCAAARARTIVRHVPLGNHFDAPPPATFDRERRRAQIGAGAAAFVVGHFGFVNRSKGVSDLVRAAGRLVAAGRDVRLLMIGEELGTSDPTNRAYLDEIRALIDSGGLEARVHWTGHQAAPEIAGWLRACDVVALPFTDGVSLRRTSAIAAWSHGVPLVTTAPPEPAAWLAGESAPAQTMPPGDPAALAAALAALHDAPDRRVHLARAGLTFAARFTWDEVARSTEAVYGAALAVRRARHAPSPAGRPGTRGAGGG